MNFITPLSLVRFLFVGLLAAVVPLTAGTILKEDFSKSPVGSFRQPIMEGGASLKTWNGPKEGTWGSFEVIEDKECTGGRALAIRDLSSVRDQAPSVLLDWPKVPAGSPALVLIELKYKIVPPPSRADGTSGAYRADILVGGSWSQAICNVIMENGQIRSHDGKKATVLGKYVPMRWQTLRMEISTKEKTFSLSVEGRLLANGLPWVNENNPSLGGLVIKADMSPTERAGDIVLMISDLSVSVQTESR
ncbi:MAG: hypothetical protein WC205_15285 [Opitutaceae bacterium]|jgi:hypothetical protein